jgi:hypothetical protein
MISSTWDNFKFQGVKRFFGGESLLASLSLQVFLSSRRCSSSHPFWNLSSMVSSNWFLIVVYFSLLLLKMSRRLYLSCVDFPIAIG